MPSESPTRQLPQGGGAHQPPSPPNPQQRGYPPAGQPPSTDTRALVKDTRRFFRNPLSIVLALVIVVLVVFAGLIGAELYTRHLAESKVAQAVGCEVQDSATASFAATPPVLWQYFNSHYTDISVQTAGNQVRDTKGMKVSINIQDVSLNKTSTSKGTIGSLNGTVTWSSDGIKQSVQDAIPVLGSFVTSSVTTNPNDGTIALKGLLDNITAKPQIVDNGLSLQIVKLTALGNTVSTDSAQKSLDDLTSKATKNYPLGIHADSVKVTDSGVEATFSTSNATIPSSSSQSSGQPSCFDGL